MACQVSCACPAGHIACAFRFIIFFFFEKNCARAFIIGKLILASAQIVHLTSRLQKQHFHIFTYSYSNEKSIK